ncbi:MAG: glutamate racemase [Coriobacteriia bacterium]|nr:glutamate racemase [Coriobacteriia bacterium]
MTASQAIGIFDSGFGGLTVARALSEELPNERLIYLGDTARCPYGPRGQEELKHFVHQITSFLSEQEVKLIVIACNTATAAGLCYAQKHFDIPVVGVVNPGARAAINHSRNRKIGVIATQGTIASGVYEQAIKSYDAGAQIFSKAAPAFVHMVEVSMAQRIKHKKALNVFTEEEYKIAHEYLDEFKAMHIDTLVLGCTHFPLLKDLIQEVVGPEIALISSAEELALEVHDILKRRDELADKGSALAHTFYTTHEDTKSFSATASIIFGKENFETNYVSVQTLETFDKDYDGNL